MKGVSLIVILNFLAGISFSQQSILKYPQAGSIHPDARYLEVDEMRPFNQGAALVRKGASTSLINSSGEYIVAFNKYFFSSQTETNSYNIQNAKRFSISGTNGVFAAWPGQSSRRPTMLVNAKGKVIYTAPAGHDIGIEQTETDDAPYDTEVATMQKNNNDNIRFLKNITAASDGSIANFPTHTEKKWGEGLYAFLDITSKKWGFKNKKGVIVIKPAFTNAHAFSEGLAAVAKENEFRKRVWGYINKEGKEVIPFKFSIEPGDFGNGLAYVVPASKDNYEFAFIDKRGEVKLTVSEASAKSLGGTHYFSGNPMLLANNKFQNGYFVGITSAYDKETAFMDTTGKILSSSEILGLFNLPDSFKVWPVPFYNGQMYFTTYDKYREEPSKKGLLNFKDHTYVPAIFDVLSFFDSVSKLAYAELVTGWDDKNNRPRKISGYINNSGVFVMVLKKPDSIW